MLLRYLLDLLACIQNFYVSKRGKLTTFAEKKITLDFLNLYIFFTYSFLDFSYIASFVLSCIFRENIPNSEMS